MSDKDEYPEELKQATKERFLQAAKEKKSEIVREEIKHELSIVAKFIRTLILIGFLVSFVLCLLYLAIQ